MRVRSVARPMIVCAVGLLVTLVNLVGISSGRETANVGVKSGAVVYGTGGLVSELTKASSTTGKTAPIIDRLGSELMGDFSPDGNEIVYWSNGAIRIIGFDGAGDRQIVPASVGAGVPSWHPGGSKVLYRDPNWDAWTVDTNGSNAQRVGTISGFSFRYSPDGSKIAYCGFDSGQWGLIVADADGTHPTVLDVFAGQTCGSVNEVSWAPDSGSIVFNKFTDNGPQPPWWDCGWEPFAFDLFMIDVNGSNLTNLTGGLDAVITKQTQPAFSPDGVNIAYAYVGHDCDSGTTTISRELRMMNRDGTGDHTVVQHASTWWMASGGATAWQACTPETVLCGVDFCGGALVTITGTSVGETIDGTVGSDVILGKGGGDTINARAGNDMVCGGGGNDILSGGGGNDVVAGGSGADAVEGGAGNDTLQGGNGNDILLGGPGSDALRGGDGSDTGDFSDATRGISADLAAGAATGRGNDTLTGVERLIGSSYGDTLFGDAARNIIWGGTGGDHIVGGGGRDTLNAGKGSDSVEGNFGDDIIRGNGGRDTLVGGRGNDTVNGGAGTDTCTGEAQINCEN